MAVPQANGVGVLQPAGDLNGPKVDIPANFKDKYDEERAKRLREDGISQYIDLRRSERYKRFLEDPWIGSGTPVNTPVSDGGHTKILVIGAGFGGILFAVKLIQAGFKKEDLLIVDPAGGFGGTWYWNRYPGLMCDIESYCYLPLLEEMDYMPKRKYSWGFEIREYAERICSKYGLHERTMFQSSGSDMRWDSTRNEWTITVVKKPKGGEETQHVVYADYVVFNTGVLNNAHLPNLRGIESFNGHMFHTARWDYSFTGGTPEDPNLTGLRGKRVGLIGTGATAVQAVPEIAKYADRLYIFQRTPSAVDVRGNHDTDPVEFKKDVAMKEGWWDDRNRNLIAHISNAQPKPEVNLVKDGWTLMPSYSALVGGPKEVTMDNVAEHVSEMHALDYPRQERIRQRVAQIIKDPTTAKSLQAWYPGWCKRPCFHDDYLPSFNLPHVSLIDTNGKGVDCITEKGIQVNGKVYELDVIIWGTGFNSPSVGSAAGKADIVVKGRDGLDLEEVVESRDLLTLHGHLARGFPNMFFAGPGQTAVAPNHIYLLETMATHVAYVLSEAHRRTASTGSKPLIQPTSEAQEEWANEVMSTAASGAAMAGCTPSYLNQEGAFERNTPEQQMKLARSGIWANGFPRFKDLLKDWRTEGSMRGLEVTPAA